jgi:hypothetical protein
METNVSLLRSKSLPLDPILSQLNPVHSHKTCFFKIYFTIIFSSYHVCYMTCPSYSLESITLIIFGEEDKL